MARMDVRIIGRPLRGKPVGEVVSLSRRDARVLTAIGRAEYVDPAEAEAPRKRRTPVRKARAKRPAKAPARARVLETPEAPLETVAHTDPPAKRTRRARKAK
jgi:hypothetical protein